MPALTAVLGVLDSSGNRIDRPDSAGNYPPVYIELEAGLTGTAVPNGGTTTIKIAASAGAATPTAIDDHDSPYAVLLTDSVLLVDTSEGAVTVTVVLATGRSIEVRDAAGTAAMNPITISAPGKTIRGDATWTIDTNWASVRLTGTAGDMQISESH